MSTGPASMNIVFVSGGRFRLALHLAVRYFVESRYSFFNQPRTTDMNENSLQDQAFRNTLFIAWAAICILGGLWVWDAYTSRMESISTLRTQIMERQREALVSEVSLVKDYIQSMNGQARLRLQRSLKDRVDELHALISSLHERYAGVLPREDLVDIIKETIRPMTYNNGRGYYFITTLKGESVLLPPFPQMEGRSMLHVSDEAGVSVIRTIIDKLQDRDVLLHSYMWPLPDEDRESLKMSYIRTFRPYGWYVGAGDYLEYVEEDIQKEVLRTLGTLHFEKSGYVFAATYDGVSLLGPAKDQNVWELRDANGEPIVQEMVRLAKKGGGFLRYQLPDFDGGGLRQDKLSYVEPVTDWDWYIGVGVTMNSVLDLLDEETRSARQDVLLHMGGIGLLLLLLSGVVYLVARRFFLEIWSEFSSFSEMFTSAVKADSLMDERQLKYSEVAKLAHSANEVLEGRRLAMRQTEELRHRLQDILDSMPSLLFAVGRGGDVVQWNTTAQEFFGERLVVGAPVDSLVPGAEALLQQALETKEPVSRLSGGRREWKGGVYLDIVVYPLQESRGPRAVIRLDDVSERIRLEEMARQGEKMASVGELAAGMAHEINNPLGIILQSGQGVLRRVSSDIPANRKVADECGLSLEQLREYLQRREIDQYLDALMNAGRRASGIVRNLLSFSQDDLSTVQGCDLAILLDKVVDLLSSELELRQQLDFNLLDIRREYGQDLPPATCVASELEQVFLNIMKNSVQAMAKDADTGKTPRLVLRTGMEGDRLRVEIEDNGPGMDEETRKRVFEPFFTTRMPGEGVGLGLSVSYFIITRNHSGEVRVKSKPGQGTTFTILLPVFG